MGLLPRGLEPQTPTVPHNRCDPLSRPYARVVSSSRQGFLYGLAAYVLWGGFPLYWPLLEPAGSVELLAHRIFWSLVTLAVLVLVLRRTRQFAALFRDRRVFGLLSLAAVVITLNWGTYIYGVTNDRVVETSLGYFINPLVTVLMGVLILGERLRRLQWFAIGVGALACLVLTVDYGAPAVDRTGPRLLVRHLRTGQEAGRSRGHREPHPRDPAGGAAGAGLPGLARRAGPVVVRRRRHRARPAPDRRPAW